MSKLIGVIELPYEEGGILHEDGRITHRRNYASWGFTFNEGDDFEEQLTRAAKAHLAQDDEGADAWGQIMEDITPETLALFDLERRDDDKPADVTIEHDWDECVLPDLRLVDPDESKPEAVVIEINGSDISVRKAPPGVFVMVRDYDLDGVDKSEWHEDAEGHEFMYRSV